MPNLLVLSKMFHSRALRQYLFKKNHGRAAQVKNVMGTESCDKNIFKSYFDNFMKQLNDWSLQKKKYFWFIMGNIHW